MIAVYVIVAVLIVVALIVAAMSRHASSSSTSASCCSSSERSRDKARGPGLIFFFPFVDRVHRVSLRIVTMPIQSQGIITKDNVSIDVSAVAYYRVEDPIRSVVAIENVSGDQSDRPDHTARGGRASHAG